MGCLRWTELADLTETEAAVLAHRKDDVVARGPHRRREYLAELVEHGFRVAMRSRQWLSRPPPLRSDAGDQVRPKSLLVETISPPPVPARTFFKPVSSTAAMNSSAEALGSTAVRRARTAPPGTPADV